MRPDPLAPPEGYGQRPGAAEPPCDTLCDWGRLPDRRDISVCGAERVCVLVAGDAAEHIAHLDLCGEHARVLAQRLAAGGRFYCTLCGNHRVEELRGTAPELAAAVRRRWPEARSVEAL